MLEKVRAYILRHHLLEPGEKVVVGVSGGPDSVTLLHVLSRLREEFQIELCIAHLNHRIRGEEAKEEAGFVTELARGWNLPVRVGEREVLALARREKLSVQDAARRERYSFLWEVAAEVGARKLAVGHHMDDQAETVLLNLLRGSGMAGLAGMQPERGGIIRPLLGVRRREVMAYLAEQGLPWRQDSSNLERHYLRNKVRLDLLPTLEKNYNPRLVEGLNKTALLLGAERDWLEEATSAALGRVLAGGGQGEIALSRAGLLEEPLALRRRLVRRAFQTLAGEDASLTIEQVERVLALGEGGFTNLPRRVGVRARGGMLRFHLQDKAALARQPFSYPLPVPGQLVIPELGRKIEAESLPVERVWGSLKLPPSEACLDLELLGRPLVVRNRRPGDAFRPLGLGGKKKLQDFFTDLKIPLEERDSIPLVCSGEAVVWVVGQRIDERWRVTGSTKRVLYLRFC